MAVDTVLFFQNLLDYSNAVGTLTASNTAVGYAIRNARVPNFMTSWKPPDSESVDEYLHWDGGTTGWLGAATDTAYCAIAYDARAADQTVIGLYYDASDNPAGSFASNAGSFTLDKTAIGVQFFSFSIPGTAKRYYRLIQANGNGRGAGSGKTRTVKIHAWAMFDKDTVFTIGGSQFPADTPAEHSLQVVDRVSSERTGIGAFVSNTYGESGQSIEVAMDPASKAIWEAIRDQLMKQRGAARANFVQHEGLRNPSQANFFLCRLPQASWSGQKRFVDLIHSTRIPFESEAWR